MVCLESGIAGFLRFYHQCPLRYWRHCFMSAKQNKLPPTVKDYFSGDFLPFSKGQISAPFQTKNSHLFSQILCLFFPIKKKTLLFLLFLFLFFFTFFRDHYYLWEAMTLIRMILLKNLCLKTIYNNLILRITFDPISYYVLSLIFPNFDIKSIIFSQFWPGTFSQNCWIKPCFFNWFYDNL